MNGRSGTFSPVSADGSEWSGISKYQLSEPAAYSPILPRGNLATPPISGSSNGGPGRMSNGMNRRPSDNPGNPSPPNSVGRSSYGTNLSSDGQRRKTLMMEESLAQHYIVLKRYLAQSLRDEKGNPKPNKARDKLLRLSPVQFQELSTDVYDELIRRQSASSAGQQQNGPSQVPAFLTPKDNFHPKRNQARQKLATLPPPRFRDLATDVFYELERRFPKFVGNDIYRNGSPAPSMRGPGSRPVTPNGTRQGPGGRGRGGPGPGTGYGSRNASLGSQVFAGAGIPEGPDGTYGRPTPKTFQSNTIVPNKSTLVEDDDEPIDVDDSRSRRDTRNTYSNVGGTERLQLVDLQGKVHELERVVREKDLALGKLQESSSNKEAELRTDLESKLANALNLNNNLESEIAKVRADHADTKHQLQSEIGQRSTRGDDNNSEWKRRYDDLNKTHEGLRIELEQQRTVTNEVKREAARFLEEMKVLSKRSDQTCEREEELIAQVYKLEYQVKEWKNRYARTRAQLKTARFSSLGIPMQQPDMGQFGKAGGFTQDDGLIRDFHVTKFQVSIDELLRAARVSEPQSVLANVKSVVVTVRELTQDVGVNPTNDESLTQQRMKLLSKVSATANNLITASKNFAVSKGLSPVSLLDAAASHLTLAVVELISVVKIRPTPVEELDDDDEDSLINESPADYNGIGRTSGYGESVYSSMSSPPPSLPPQSNRNTHTAPKQIPLNDSSSNNYARSALQPGNATRGHGGEVEELKVTSSTITCATHANHSRLSSRIRPKAWCEQSSHLWIVSARKTIRPL